MIAYEKRNKVWSEENWRNPRHADENHSGTIAAFRKCHEMDQLYNTTSSNDHSFTFWLFENAYVEEVKRTERAANRLGLTQIGVFKKDLSFYT